jgi:hypothetical protein
MNNNTKLTFNETSYEFTYFLGRNKITGETFNAYGVYINGALNTDYVLEEGTETSGHNNTKKIWLLYWKSFYLNFSIDNFSLEEVVKVISYIREREGENLLDGLTENPNNFDDAFPEVIKSMLIERGFTEESI